MITTIFSALLCFAQMKQTLFLSPIQGFKGVFTTMLLQIRSLLFAELGEIEISFPAEKVNWGDYQATIKKVKAPSISEELSLFTVLQMIKKNKAPCHKFNFTATCPGKSVTRKIDG
ncbi:hypothetical protein PEPS_41620 (plasmid) [Persicobacter psychrovividus]|uniref:Uncharacterized protein n=2 Tax=Persicobacter psychrovividus TaxID=387638 RepID=A0ABM7VLK9_9BACT|nr:hypothetical protein PEPS_41620 [Persicobacter psychrovividus]